jgi:hypothetical protein
LAAVAQQLFSAFASAAVPQHVLAAWLSEVVAAAGPPQQPLAAGGVNASAGLPAKPPAVWVVDWVVMIFLLLWLLPWETLPGVLSADQLQPGLSTVLGGADLATFVAELDTAQRHSRATHPLQHDPLLV